MLSHLCMLCFDKTCLHEPMWEMCLLFGVIWYYACGCENNMYASKGFLLLIIFTSIGTKILSMKSFI
jgi:hypothetical protein